MVSSSESQYHRDGNHLAHPNVDPTTHLEERFSHLEDSELRDYLVHIVKGKPPKLRRDFIA